MSKPVGFDTANRAALFEGLEVSETPVAMSASNRVFSTPKRPKMGRELTLTPNLFYRLLSPTLQSFSARIIDPESGHPFIDNALKQE